MKAKDLTILQLIRYTNQVPKLLRNVNSEVGILQDVLARAADEIERLQKENKKLKRELENERYYSDDLRG